MKKQLNLKPEGTENRLVKTFEVEQLQTCEYINFNVKTNPIYPDISLTAFVVPQICQPLSHQRTKAAKINCPHLKELTFADLNTGDEELEIDMLVGSDQYWNFMTGGARREVFGPSAMETKLGWVLSCLATDSTSTET